MARLIPSFMDDGTPPGEVDVFNLLSAGPDDWVIIHSLDLAPWNRYLRTEIDFVVIVPDTGILCIEVKSQTDISFDGVRWYPQSIKRSPFKQAADGRYTFYRQLKRVASDFKVVPVLHCCIFPRSSFHLSTNLSVQPWELMDQRVFRNFKNGLDFCENLKQRIKQSIAADVQISPLATPLSKGQVDRLVNLCVPVHKVSFSARDEIKFREEAIEKLLRDQQKPVLQLAAMNNRVVVSGGAGTGKTLIAMEVARRAAEKGQRVALLCYNKLVGNWMREKVTAIKPPLPNLLVGRANQVMAGLAGIDIADEPSNSYWDSQLPQELLERLTDPEFNAIARFDYLVVDEAQDILARPWLWQCLVQFLEGGEAGGSLALFGDFEYQVLKDRDTMQSALDTLETLNPPVKWKLSENCRNYRIVGDTAVQLAGFKDLVYEGYMRPGGGLHNYDIYFYDNGNSQMDKLAQWLKEFRAEGYKPSEITVLSFNADKSCAALRLSSDYNLQPAWQSGARTKYSSVQAFKGLENKVVIVTDVALTNRVSEGDLLYSAITRATESVRVLCEKQSEKILLTWLQAN